MKHLICLREDLATAYNTFSNSEFRVLLGDLLSLLSIVNLDTSYDILTYRLASPLEHIGHCGHEYVRCLTLAVIRAFKKLTALPPGTALGPLIQQISQYYMTHNDQPDACDLLLQVKQLPYIVSLVEEESRKRVCTCLLQCSSYLLSRRSPNLSKIE
jgi:hypothetical protein